jgi:hypothetical protein
MTEKHYLVEYLVIKANDPDEGYFLRVMIEKVHHHSDHGPFATLQACEDFRELVMRELRETGGAYDAPNSTVQ